MGMEELEITVDKEGKIRMQVRGVKGPRCEEVTKPLEEALGELEERRHTSEYYEDPESSKQRRQIREGNSGEGS